METIIFKASIDTENRTMTDNYEVREVIDKETISAVKSVGETYKYGFSTDIETEYAPLGLNEDIVRPNDVFI